MADMAGEHRRRANAAGNATPQQLCETVQRATGMASMSVMLSPAGRPMCSASSGELGRLMEDLQ